MRMADIVSEMCSFSTNTTFCHNCTSLQLTKPTYCAGSQQAYSNRKADTLQGENEFFIKKRKYRFHFSVKEGIITLYVNKMEVAV